MCDTFVALGAATPGGGVVFGKNSDREPSEPQGLEFHPAREHPMGARTSATYISLPAALTTRAVLLSRPYWMWGAEMGVNDCGVAAGNEAVFTKVAPGPPALLGMDVVRLVLERARSAEAAAQLAAELIEEFGQGGSAGHTQRGFRYDNSFLFADRDSAWALETAGRAWVLKRVSGVYAISNRLRLRDDWHAQSKHLSAYARDQGCDPGRGKLDFARTFSDPLYSWAAGGARRQSRVETLLSARFGRIDGATALEVLRDHGRSGWRGELPRCAGSLAGSGVCAHAGPRPDRRAAQTTASLAWDHNAGAEDCSGLPPIWVTGTSAPCTSLYKPLWLDAVPPLAFPGGSYDSSLWWQHERLHRRARSAPPALRASILRENCRVEAGWFDSLNSSELSQSQRRAFSVAAFNTEQRQRAAWLARLPQQGTPWTPTARYWRALNQRAGLPR